MKYALDNIKDADDAVAYVERSRSGVVRSLREIHDLLTSASQRVDEPISHKLIEKARLIVEAQLDY